MEVIKHGILLEKTTRGFEDEGVFNPAVIADGGFIHLFYRAVRQENYSSIGYCKLKGPLNVVERKETPILFPEKEIESQGVEDPRIVKIEDVFYLTYSAYDKMNVFGTYATSTDLKKFKKQDVITPKLTYREYKHLIQCCTGLNKKYSFHYNLFEEHGLAKELSEKLYIWDKNVMFFPRKINGKFALLHRIYPGIQIVYFDSFEELNSEFWSNYMMNLDKSIVMDPKYDHESNHIGGGCPPIETEEGWLLIYHTVQNTPEGLIYRASAALLDLENPTIELSRLKKPLISPTEVWEKEGAVNNVIFPSGAVIYDDLLYIYYGAADSKVCVASVQLKDLLKQLEI